MGRKRARKNINFRETHSERSATNSYRGFNKYRKKFEAQNPKLETTLNK